MGWASHFLGEVKTAQQFHAQLIKEDPIMKDTIEVVVALGEWAIYTFKDGESLSFSLYYKLKGKWEYVTAGQNLPSVDALATEKVPHKIAKKLVALLKNHYKSNK